MSFRNTGVRNIWVYPTGIGKCSFGAGILLPDAEKTTLSFYEPIPNTVEVKWKNGVGNIVQKEVKVKENIPSCFRTDRDCIIFNIDGNDDIELSFRIKTGQYQWKEIDSKGNKFEQ
jgi:hypothetical protein